MSRVLGIVPARAGSRRVANKNLRMLGGRPLVAWALDAARRARLLDVVVLSSNDEEALALGANFHGVECLRRPDDLSGDHAPAMGYVLHALEALTPASGPPFDAIAIIQPSSPFTEPDDIDATVRLLLESDADSAVSVVELEHAIHPLKLKRLVGDRLVAYLEEEKGRMSEHELPKLFVRNGSVYVTRPRTLAHGTLLGDDSRGFVMPRDRSVDINDETDLAFAEFLFGRRATTPDPPA